MTEKTNQLLKDMAVLQYHFSKAGTSIYEKYGISTINFYLLSRVKSIGQPTQKELATELNLTKGAISQMMQILERKGLILRHKEKKYQYVQLTEKSNQILEKALPETDILADRLFSKLTKKEFDLLRKIINVLLAHPSG